MCSALLDESGFKAEFGYDDRKGVGACDRGPSGLGMRGKDGLGLFPALRERRFKVVFDYDDRREASRRVIADPLAWNVRVGPAWVCFPRCGKGGLKLRLVTAGRREASERVIADPLAWNAGEGRLGSVSRVAEKAIYYVLSK